MYTFKCQRTSSIKLSPMLISEACFFGVNLPVSLPRESFRFATFHFPGCLTLGNSRSLREERDGARQEASELRCAASQVEGGGVPMTDPWDW